MMRNHSMKWWTVLSPDSLVPNRKSGGTVYRFASSQNSRSSTGSFRGFNKVKFHCIFVIWNMTICLRKNSKSFQNILKRELSPRTPIFLLMDRNILLFTSLKQDELEMEEHLGSKTPIGNFVRIWYHWKEGFLDKAAHSSTATALAKVVAWVLPLNKFENLIDEHPRLAIKIMRNASTVMRNQLTYSFKGNRSLILSFLQFWLFILQHILVLKILQDMEIPE